MRVRRYFDPGAKFFNTAGALVYIFVVLWGVQKLYLALGTLMWELWPYWLAVKEYTDWLIEQIAMLT